MDREFRFPVPRSERIVMLTAAFVTPGLVAALIAALANVAAAVDLTLGQLVAQSRPLRAVLASMALIYVCATYAMVAFMVVKRGSRLNVGERIAYTRPAIPLFGWLGRSVVLAAERVDGIYVRKVRRWTFERVEVRLTAGRDEVAVNLGHAVESDKRRGKPGTSPDEWRQTALVRALEEATGLEAVS